MSSSSSSHKQNQEFNAFSGKIRMVCESSRLFDVFINHRGPDVKQTLALQLYNSLEQLGIRTFLDSQEKQLGDSFPSTIETAIRSASVHVAIFSKGYADSPWCLAELLLMLESEAKIIPVFYQVKPSDLRYIETGAYAEAFIKYKVKGRYLKMLNEWKEALQSLSLIAGEEFDSDWHCEKIVAAVQKEVQRKTPLHVAQYPVGLNNLVKEFERRCLEELVEDFENQCRLKKAKDRAKVVGIFGMGGLGKTTLAKELFNRKSSNYQRASFLFDVREASERRELPSLQFKLLKDLFDKDLRFRSIEEGTSYLKDSLQKSPAYLSFLIVLDDIDHVEQLNALLIMDILNKLGNSLVIVTTRDIGVLITAGITEGYRLKGMDKNHGSELFCRHAFDQPNPLSGYEELVKSFVNVCGGIPLSLQVLGRHVRGRSKDYWRSELVEVRKTLPRDVKQRLRISFDALNAAEKQVFMDIACFFGGREQSIAERVWEGSGWNAQHALETLRDKCLIEETNIDLRMHDHLRDLGREMALELSPPHRLWHPDDLKRLELRSFKNILTEINVRCFHSIFDEAMNSRVTFFLGQSDNRAGTSARLLWLELEGNSTKQSMKSIPSWIPLQSLQCLKIKGGRFTTLWKNRIQAPSQLKSLDITNCKHLKSLSRISNIAKLVELNIHQCAEVEELNLGHLNCLETITILDCKHLKNVSGISNLAKLVLLNISQCSELVELTLGHLICLERITIVDCKHLKNVSGTSNLPKLVELNIHQCEDLQELILGHLSCLETITVVDCKHLKNVSGISNLAKLVLLNISQCSELEELTLSHLSCLETITIANLQKLSEMNICQCAELEELTLDQLSCLEKITIVDCEHLKNVLGTSSLPKLAELNIHQCAELEELTLGHLSCLEIIRIEDCKHLRNVLGISNLAKLVLLNISQCSELEELTVSHLSCLETITIANLQKLAELNIHRCTKLEELSLDRLSCLERITIGNCQELKNVSGTPDLTKLVELNLHQCAKLKELSLGDFTLGHLRSLKRMTIANCKSLKYLPGAPNIRIRGIKYFKI
ncbi:disease resistance protein Roq1 [Cryptomeria japonica]|uniref:disease resistance protein Roq1 n=1 Tax=Cryptomeria japonica TaxID=3369 RepID=UPI0027DA21A6|nr:disease resistance protein Roq1 [Cryptomeria japonica]